MEVNDKEVLTQKIEEAAKIISAFNEDIFNTSVRPVDIIFKRKYSQADLANPTKEMLMERADISLTFAYNIAMIEKIKASMTAKNPSVEKLQNYMNKVLKWQQEYRDHSADFRPQRMVCSRDYMWIQANIEMLAHEKAELSPGDTEVCLPDTTYFTEVKVSEQDKFISRKFFEKGGTAEQVDLLKEKIKSIRQGYEKVGSFDRPTPDMVDLIDHLLVNKDLDTDITSRTDKIKGMEWERLAVLNANMDSELLNSDLLKDYDLYLTSGDIESNILEIYNILFTPCFIAPPEGVITYKPGTEGHGALVAKEGAKLAYVETSGRTNQRLDRMCNYFINYGDTKPESRGRVLESRRFEVSKATNSHDIAQAIVEYWMKNKDKDLKILTFPFLIAEFAFGLKQTGATGYEKKDLGWEDYKTEIVAPKVTEILSWCKYEFIERNADNEEDIIDFGGDIIAYAGECLTTTEVLTVLDKTSSNSEKWIQFSLISSDSQGFTTGNTGIKPLSESYARDMDKQLYNPNIGNIPRPLNLYKPKDNRISKTVVVEYRVVYDYVTVEKTPIFAYHAVAQNIKNGVLPVWDKLPIGKLDNGSPVYHQFIENGTMNHFVIAGSRAGKGVTTLSFLAAAMINKRPIIYFDNKPDMFSTMYDLGLKVGLKPWEMFIIEGPSQSQSNDSSLDGTRKGLFQDYLNTCLNGGRMTEIQDTNGNYIIPSYIHEIYTNTLGLSSGTNEYDIYGSFVYFRALLFMTGMLGFLTRDGYMAGGDPTGLYTDLKDRGIVVVVDELSALVQSFRQTSLNILKNVACYDKIKEANYQKLKSSSKPEDQVILNSVMGPGPLYLELLMESLISTEMQVSDWELKGKDAKGVDRADIITIGQHVNFSSPPYTLQETMSTGRPKTFSAGINKGYYSVDIGDFMVGILSYKKSDAILGYNMIDQLYLAQNMPDSPASSKLNEDAKGFAYVPEFEYTGAKVKNFNKAIQDSRIVVGGGLERDTSDRMRNTMLGYAKDPSVEYFKPYLILNSHLGGPVESLKANFFNDVNPARDQINRVGFLQKYGSKTQIEKLEANPDLFVSIPEMDLSPGVGFHGYMDTICEALNQPGIKEKWLEKTKFEAPANAEEAIHYALSTPAKAASFVIREILQYPCTEETWMNFFADMRPEWFFTAEDIEKAFRYGNNKLDEIKNIDGTLRARGRLKPEDAKINKILKYWGDTEWAQEDYSGMIQPAGTQNVDIDTTGDAIYDAGPGMMDSLMTAEDLLGDTPDTIKLDTPYMPMDDDKFTFTANDIDTSDIDTSDPDTPSPIPTPSPTPTPSPIPTPTPTPKPQGMPTPDPLPVVVPPVAGPAVKKAAEVLKQVPKPVAATRAETDYKYYQAEIEALSTPAVDTIAYPIKIDKRGGMIMGADLVPLITRAVILNAGGLDKIKTFVVTADEHLIINGKNMKTAWDTTSHAQVGQGYADQISTGRIATLFDYSLLLHGSCANIEKLVFKDAEFAEQYVNPFLQRKAGSKFDIELMFEAQTKLQMLVLGEQIFQRADYKTKLKDYDETYRVYGFFSGMKLFHTKMGKNGWSCVGKTYKGAFRQFTEGHFIRGIGSIIGGTLFTTGLAAGNLLAGAGGLAAGAAHHGRNMAKMAKGRVDAGDALSYKGLYTSADMADLGQSPLTTGATTDIEDQNIWDNAMKTYNNR